MDLARDVRHAIRALRRSPGFTVVALLTLALGIGANTAIFSIVNAVILKPLDYPRPEQLMYLTTQFAGRFNEFWVSPPEYLEFRDINRSFSAVGVYTTGEANLTAGDRPLRVRSASVDEHLLAALGIPPAQGRLFAARETDVSGAQPAPGQPALLPPPVAILSYELWQRAFGGGSIVGQTVEINGRSSEVVGIMPPDADIVDNRTELWLPLGLNPANRQNRGNHYLYLIGRLKGAVTPQAAQAELDGLIRNWGERVGVNPANHVFAPLSDPNSGHILQMKPLRDQVIGAASRSIWVLQAAVGVVLLIACVNVASLLLARAETRHQELAVRTALGAGRWRLLQTFMTEAVLLSIAGGTLGVLLARFGVQALLRAYPASLPRTGVVTVDPVALLFTGGVAVGTGVLFGLAPIAHTKVRGLVDTLKDGGTRGATGAMRNQIRRALVVAEVALAVMVAIGAGLLVRSVRNLADVDAGFSRTHLTTFSITLPAVNYAQPVSRLGAYQRLLDALRALPGVQGATSMSGLPPNRPINANDTQIENYVPPPKGPFANVDYYQTVMTDYFETMGIPIVEGRSFQPIDAASSGMVAVVNETLVRTFWDGQNPIGKRLRPCCGDQIPWFTVIGVAKDVKQAGVDQKTGTEFYRFLDQTVGSARPLALVNTGAPVTMNFVLRTTLPPSTLAATVERAVRDVDRSVPVVRFREMDDVFADAIRRPRLMANLVSAFAGLALLLATIGTYGVLSYIVAERRREIGIRMALGADRANVLVHVMRQGLQLAVVGGAAGVAGAIGLTRLMSALLFGVKPTDVRTMGIALAAITFAAAVACALPAWRASRLDPNVVLRQE